MAGKSRNWCFTINNPTPSDFIALQTSNNQWNNALITLVYALENAAPEESASHVSSEGISTSEGETALSYNSDELQYTGTPHLQGYLELSSSRSMDWIKRRLPRAHLEPRVGTRAQAILYCMKEGEEAVKCIWGFNENSYTALLNLMQPTSKQTATKKNERAERLMEMKKMIDEGKTNKELADYHFPTFVSCFRGLDKYRLMVQPKRQWKTEVFVIQGPTGTGKSKWCADNYPNAYWKQRGAWWDGYEGEETVIMDEFYGWIPFDTLLRIADRYPCMVETKGGQTQFLAKRLIITSNKRPDLWYKDVYFDSFIRRVDQFHVFPVWGMHEFYDTYEAALPKMFNNTITP